MGPLTFSASLASPAATRALGRRLGALLEAGDCVALEGDLGAGKTLFARAVCEGAAVPKDVHVASPTFALVNVYEGGRVRLVHADLYRLAGPDELYAIGWDDLVAGGGALLVEWAERVPGALPPERLRVQLAHGARASERLVTLSGDGGRGAELVTRLAKPPAAAASAAAKRPRRGARPPAPRATRRRR